MLAHSEAAAGPQIAPRAPQVSIFGEKRPDLMTTESVPAARYFNFIQIGHNAFEFIFEFGHIHQNEGEPTIQTRLVTAPTYARELLDLIRESIEQYERAFGLIHPE